MVTKYVTRRNSGEKGFILGSQFEVTQSSRAEEAWYGDVRPLVTLLVRAGGVKKHRT